MNITLLGFLFLIFSFSFCNVSCGELEQVELDYRKSTDDYLENFEKSITEHMKDVKSELQNDDTAEISYVIKPPNNSENTPPILLKKLEKTISKLAPTLDYNISSEHTAEQTGDERKITLIEYHLTFSGIKTHEDVLIVDSNSDDDSSTKKDQHDKNSQENSSKAMKIDTTPDSTESSTEKVRKDSKKLFKSKKNYRDGSIEKQRDVVFKSKKAKSRNRNADVSSEETSEENDAYDISLDPIEVENSDEEVKEKIISELQRHIKVSKQNWWFKRSNTVLFKFEMPKHMTITEISHMVEDIYLDLEDIEPKSKIYPAQIKNKSVQIKVVLPPIGRMAVTRLRERFPHVIDRSIPFNINGDLTELPSRIEEILEYELFMSKRRDSGEKIYLNLKFNVQKGESEDDYSDFVQTISRHLKAIDDVKFVSYEWKSTGKNRKNLIVKIKIPYSVNKAHEGLRVVAETQGKKKIWFGLIKSLL